MHENHQNSAVIIEFDIFKPTLLLKKKQLKHNDEMVLQQ